MKLNKRIFRISYRSFTILISSNTVSFLNNIKVHTISFTEIQEAAKSDESGYPLSLISVITVSL